MFFSAPAAPISATRHGRRATSAILAQVARQSTDSSPHAVLGGSPNCIATYPGDFAQALIALDATVEVLSAHQRRTISFAELHRLPGERPNVETSLAPDEMIAAFFVPAAAWTRRSRFVKVRDRESFEFALASAAVALDMGQDGVVNEARVALGGVATVPWRAREAESVLAKRQMTAESQRRPPRRPSAPRSRANSTRSRSRSAAGRSSAPSSRPQRSRSDMANGAPSPQANMGQPIPRFDARVKVTGAVRYPSDEPLANPAFACLATSSIARGAIREMNLDRARAVPGVLNRSGFAGGHFV
jgi:hypothetical protein